MLQSSVYKKAVMERNNAIAYQVPFPCLVGGSPTLYVVDDVENKKGDKKNRTGKCPHDLPVPVGSMTQHVFYVFFKPVIRR